MFDLCSSELWTFAALHLRRTSCTWRHQTSTCHANIAIRCILRTWSSLWCHWPWDGQCMQCCRGRPKTVTNAQILIQDLSSPWFWQKIHKMVRDGPRFRNANRRDCSSAASMPHGLVRESVVVFWRSARIRPGVEHETNREAKERKEGKSWKVDALQGDNDRKETMIGWFD